jgi:hypothetical protein
MFMCMRAYVNALRLAEPLRPKPLIGHDFNAAAAIASAGVGSGIGDSGSNGSQSTYSNVMMVCLFV